MKKKKQTGAPISPPTSVEILGRRELLISGCTGILHLTEEKIGVRAKKTSVWICGGGLVVSWAGSGRLMIRGRIDSLEYKGDE
ncbi:MAG: YabP/YqfC family sporulation protein [Clostridia bacterium]|nr:YabP/YqfC family sporulation protein [Clostridia bacterium]